MLAAGSSDENYHPQRGFEKTPSTKDMTEQDMIECHQARTILQKHLRQSDDCVANQQKVPKIGKGQNGERRVREFEKREESHRILTGFSKVEVYRSSGSILYSSLPTAT